MRAARTLAALLPLLFSLVLLSGCEGVLGLPAPESPDRLAVFSFFNPDSTWRVEVYRLADPDEVVVSYADLAIGDAQVVLWRDADAVLAETLHHVGRGVYRSMSSAPAVGATYTVEVERAGFPTTRASDRVPSLPGVSVSVRRVAGDGYTSTYAATLRLTDSEARYYRLAAFERRPRQQQTDGTQWIPVFFRSQSPMLRSRIEDVGLVSFETGSSAYETAYFDDEAFADGEVEIELTFTRPSDMRGPVYYVVTAMSESYFHYHRSLALQRANLDDPLADATALEGNIEGGEGVFASYNNAVRVATP